MIKILHCADLHLDSPFTDSLQKGEARRAKLRSAFTNMTRFASEHGVNLILMAGDLFDSEFVTRETAALLVRQAEALPSCRFVISPGNHDPYTQNSIYARTEFPENVTVFSSSEPNCVSFDDLDVDIYGYAFTETSLSHAPISNLRPARPDRINLLCAHADLSSPLSPYAPLSREEIAACGMDYVALGHVHACSGLQSAGNTYYAYSGCLEGRGFDELGYKGALYLEISKENGSLRVEASEKRFSFGRYEIARVDLGGAKTAEEALSAIRTALKEEKLLGADTTLRLILSGCVSPSVTNLAESVKDAISSLVYALEVRDQTLPLLDADRLAGDVSLRGAFYRRLLPQIESNDEETRARAIRALTLGLAALADEPVSRPIL